MTGETVVVMAFKTVYTLELKRRDNEKKIIALYVEMKDMMGVLLLCALVFTYRISCLIHIFVVSGTWKMTSSSHLMEEASKIASGPL